jgi:hypothetical protein
MTKDEWENICDRCGKCCGLSVPRDGTGIACPSLDTETNLCKNYENRFKVETCVRLNPENIIPMYNNNVLPRSCAYVEHMMGEEITPCQKARLIPFMLGNIEGQNNYIEERNRRLPKRNES